MSTLLEDCCIARRKACFLWSRVSRPGGSEWDGGLGCGLGMVGDGVLLLMLWCDE